MNEITSAVISSIRKDLSSRRGKVVFFGLALAFFIVIVDLFCLRSRSPGSVRQQIAPSALSVTDETGNKWILDLVRGQQFPRISQSDRKPGAPLIVKTSVRKINNNRYSIGIIVEGQAGEKYIGGALKNGKREPEPQFRIVDEKGRIIGNGRFEYG